MIRTVNTAFLIIVSIANLVLICFGLNALSDFVVFAFLLPSLILQLMLIAFDYYGNN